ncbi:hypothetical protein ACXET9_07140 [Brachybacterium sp. DNPG3]
MTRLIHRVPDDDPDDHDLLQHICPCTPDLTVTATPDGRTRTVYTHHHHQEKP